MPRRTNPFARRRQRGGPTAPKPIKVVAPKLDASGLAHAYEWFPVDRKAAFRLAFEWFSNNLTTLLYGDPLTEDRQRSYDRAVKSKNIGDSTDFGEEQITAWSTAIRLYEKTWPSRNLPKLDEAMANTEPSRRVANVQTVLSSLNAAFAGRVKFGMTFGSEREFVESEILIPASEIDSMIPQTPLKTALGEVPTVAKVLSIVTDDEGNQSLDGTRFMEMLPLLLSDVSAWAAGDRDLSSKVVGKATVVRPAKTAKVPGTAGPSAPRTSIRGSVITVLNAALLPRMAGKRGRALDMALTSGTVSQLKADLETANLKGYSGFVLKMACEAGAIEVS